jgi:hypothetical protein
MGRVLTIMVDFFQNRFINPENILVRMVEVELRKRV